MPSELPELDAASPSAPRAVSVRRGPPVGGLTAALLMAAWLAIDPRTPDLAAQVYRVGLFERVGLSLWDERWYAGHDLLGYSLIYPALASLVGIRLLAVVCVLASSLLFERLAVRVYGAPGRFGAVWFALAASADAWIGRLTFALGVAVALAAALALASGRRSFGALLAALCAAASPLAGVLLAFAAFTYAISRRSMRNGVWLIAPVALVLLALAGLFPEGGFEPYPLRSFLATVAVALAFLWALPRGQPMLRTGAVLYLLVCVASVLTHTPMGSNIERYGVLLAAPLLVCSLPGARPTPRAALALAAIGLWTVWGPIREVAAVAGSASTRASYYLPVRRFLEDRAGGPVRIEVPFTRSHWEAALLAPYVSLARGWERQLDKRYDSAIEANPLPAATYYRWLKDNAVSYVALPDAPIDPSSRGEAALIRERPPFLREMLRTAHWRLFAVLGATSLASPPATLTALGSDSFTLRFAQAGTSTVRVRYTRYLTSSAGRACVRADAEGWTAVTASAPGSVTVAARFSLARALGIQSRCQ